MTDNLKRAEECGAVVDLFMGAAAFIRNQLDLYTAKVIEEAMKWRDISTAPEGRDGFFSNRHERNYAKGVCLPLSQRKISRNGVAR